MAATFHDHDHDPHHPSSTKKYIYAILLLFVVHRTLLLVGAAGAKAEAEPKRRAVVAMAAVFIMVQDRMVAGNSLDIATTGCVVSFSLVRWEVEVQDRG